jgi:TPR repeat protein
MRVSRFLGSQVWGFVIMSVLVGSAAQAQKTNPTIDKEIGIIEQSLRAGKGSKAYIESVGALRAGAWKQAAEKGTPAGQFLYGRALELGAGVKQDQQEALRWQRKSAEAGFALAQNVLGYSYDRGEGVSKDEREAVRWYRKAADQGLVVAQHNLGYSYRNGTGTDRNGLEAVKWFRKAADQGYPPAFFQLAEIYRQGEGVEKDLPQSVRLYRKAAVAGHAYSFFELANCYSNGIGVEKDAEEAEKCYRRGADAGDFECQCMLANWHLDGRTGKPDLGEALKLLKKAEGQATEKMGKRKVELALVRTYRASGIELLDGGKKDQAAQKLRDALKLAEKLDKEYPGRFYIEDALSGCFLDLGRYHEELRELEKAAAYFQKSFDLGNTKAATRLAKMYETGAGVPKNTEKARALKAKVDSFKMVRFKVPAEIKGTPRFVPIEIYIRDDFRGADPLKSQELWFQDEGIIIPAKVKESFAMILKIAQENKVSFVDLCKYALGKKDEPSPPEKSK